MGLEQVIGDVRRDGDQRAQKVLDDAKAEAERILTAAKDKAKMHQDSRATAAAKDAEQLKAQIISSAEFEARKTVLTTEAELRAELKQIILDGFAAIGAGPRKKHITKLLKTAQGTIAKGSVFGAAADAAILEKQDHYTYGGTTDIIGGIIVESESGKNRLDLSYGTLLGDMWRDVLKQEAELFS
jgi:V/A-type H+-transporting ATPase subunit E